MPSPPAATPHGAGLGPDHRHRNCTPHRPHRPGAGGGDRPGRRPLATAGSDSTVRIWDPLTGAGRATLTGHTDEVVAVAIAPDGGGWPPPARRTARIWDPITGTERPTSPATPARCAAVAIAPDGAWLATASDDGTVRIWDAGTGAPRATLTGHTERCERWRSPRTAPRWPPPAATGRCGSGTRPPAQTAPPSPATPACVGGGDRPGRQLPGHRRQRRHGADLGPGHRPTAPPSPATPAGDRGGDRPGRHLAGHRQQRRHGADLGPGHRRRPAPPSPATPARCGRWRSPRTARWLATAGDDGTVRIWDPRTGGRATPPHRPHRPGRGGGDRPGRHAGWPPPATTGRRGSGTPHRRRARPHRPHRLGAAVAIAPDGTWLATAGSDDGTAADLGPGHRGAAAPPHRPHRPGAGGGLRPGRQLAGHRRDDARCGSGTRHRRGARHPHRPHRPVGRWRSPRTDWLATASGGRHGADLGSAHRHRQRATLTGHTGPVQRRWPSPRTAAGWPPPARRPVGSGIRTPARTHPHRPHRPVRAGASPRTAAGWPPAATTCTIRIWNARSGASRWTGLGFGVTRAGSGRPLAGVRSDAPSAHGLDRGHRRRRDAGRPDRRE